MEIVLIHSYKGGSGKTTIAVNLANELAVVYNKSVLLIEMDFKMPSFFVIFKELHPEHYLNEFYHVNPVDLAETIVNYTANLDIIFKKMQLIPSGRIPCSCMGSYDMARGINIFPPEHEINRYMAPLLS